jgi:DUF917 family protein
MNKEQLKKDYLYSSALHFKLNINTVKLSLEHIEDLTRSIRKEFMLGHINIYGYERMINLLTCVQLQLEDLNKQNKKFISEGTYFDKKA